MDPSVDGVLKIVILSIAALILIRYSTVFEREYHSKLTELYTYPWWRFLVLFLILSAAAWCPTMGIFIAFIGFLYLSDMNTLIEPLLQ